MFRFFPKDEKFFEMFEASSANVLKGARLLLKTVQDYRDLEKFAEKMKEIEHDGDIITHRTMEKLNKTFVTPIDREDIHSLICRMDDVLDFIESTSSYMWLYKINKPTKELVEMVKILVKCVEEITEAVSHLRDLKKSKHILLHCIEINRMENEVDQINRRVSAQLFEKVSDPVEIIKWKEIYHNVESALDRCEDVANVIEGVVLKNA